MQTQQVFTNTKHIKHTSDMTNAPAQYIKHSCSLFRPLYIGYEKQFSVNTYQHSLRSTRTLLLLRSTMWNAVESSISQPHASHTTCKTNRLKQYKNTITRYCTFQQLQYILHDWHSLHKVTTTYNLNMPDTKWCLLYKNVSGHFKISLDHSFLQKNSVNSAWHFVSCVAYFGKSLLIPW